MCGIDTTYLITVVFVVTEPKMHAMFSISRTDSGQQSIINCSKPDFN